MGNINIEALINAASSKLGVSPQQLKDSLNSGKISDITSRMSKSDREKINSVMNNPQLAEKLRRQFMNGKNNG